jgi:antitoxin MazE
MLMAAMKTNIIQIGNSRGIRIPKAILEQCRLDGEVELESRGDHLVVRPAGRARQNWDEVFRAMGERDDDTLLDGDVVVETSWEMDEWQW